MHTRLRELRKALSLSQTQFGKRLSCTQQTVCMWENHEREMRNQIVKQICHEFNVNEEWLREGKGEMFAKPANESQSIRDFQRAFCQRVFNSLPSDVQDVILEVVRDERMRKEYAAMRAQIQNESASESTSGTDNQAPNDDGRSSAKAEE